MLELYIESEIQVLELELDQMHVQELKLELDNVQVPEQGLDQVQELQLLELEPELQVLELELNQDHVQIYESKYETISTVDINNYDNIIQKIKKKNNNSVYINTQIRNPELQNIYRMAIIQRYNKCIISNYDEEVCEASHIIPFAEIHNFDINNGLLLNNILHKLFDKYYWSLTPDLIVITNHNKYNFLSKYNGKKIEILQNYPITCEYLKNHYNEFLKRLENNSHYNNY